jgi:exodeoxyribonuclease VII large subunit
MTDWVFTVTEAGDFIKKSLESEPLLQSISIRGEISDYKRAASGHVYFSLKDEHALLRCAWFRQDQKAGFSLAEGMKVTARGRLSYYSEQGQLNFYIRDVKNDGTGSLYLLFEQRKERFRQRGWFDEAHKRALPAFPSSIGVVTSPTGAVIRDIIRIARRRNPSVKIVLYPVRVQGDGAAREIAQGIETFNALGNVDALIVGRGGGSFEDLWEFNDEQVVKAVYESSIPVITAIGHETDFTLADFAADRRAATPSEAAELLVPDVMALARTVTVLSARLSRQFGYALDYREQRIAFLQQALTLHGPQERLDRFELRLDNLSERMQTAFGARIASREQAVDSLENRLRGLDPMAVLGRGYAAVYSEDRGEYVSRGIELVLDENINIRFFDTSRSARVNENAHEPLEERGLHDMQPLQ